MTHHILIADDEPSVLAVLRIFFERQGYGVTTAINGREVVERGAGILPDLVILDIQMPYKTGVEAATELRADPRYRRVPFVAMTAYVRDYLPSDVLEAGFAHVLSKPFDLAELHGVVTALLQSRQRAEGQE